jgi:hypothetical protein
MKRVPSNVSIPPESGQRPPVLWPWRPQSDLGPDLASSTVNKTPHEVPEAEPRLGYRANANGILPIHGRNQQSVLRGMPHCRSPDRKQRRMTVVVRRTKTHQCTAKQKSSCSTGRIRKNRHPDRKPSCQSGCGRKRARQHRSNQQPCNHLIHPSQHSHWLFLEESSLPFVAKIGRHCDQCALALTAPSSSPMRQPRIR